MLKHRLLYGLLVGSAFAAGMMYLPGPLLFLLLTAFSAACQWEFYALAERGGYRVYRSFGLLLGVLWMAAVYLLASPGRAPHPAYPEWEGAMLIGIAFAVLLRTLGDRDAGRALEPAALTLLGLFYAPLMLSYFMRLSQWDAAAPLQTTRSGVFLAFYAAFIVKISDTGAYAFGMRFGRHKLFPRVSPAKSWEGLVGGLATAVLCSVLLARAATLFHWGPEGVFWTLGRARPAIGARVAVGFGVVLTGVGVCGDLFESMLKRAVGVKDSSGVIPGMGGLLDVIDSLVFAPACLFFYLVWAAA